MLSPWGQGPEAPRGKEAVKDIGCQSPRSHPDRLIPPPPGLRSQSLAPLAPHHLRLWSRLNPAPQTCRRSSHFRKPARRARRLSSFRDLSVLTALALTSLPLGGRPGPPPPTNSRGARAATWGVVCVTRARHGVCVKQISFSWCSENGGTVGGVCELRRRKSKEVRG